MEKFEIICICGEIAHATYREKDTPYSSYGIWEFLNLNCKETSVEKKFTMSRSEAVVNAEPKCKKCGHSITSNNFTA